MSSRPIRSSVESLLKDNPPTQLEFVTFSQPHQLQSPHVKRTIRQQAGRSGATKYRKHRRPKFHIFELYPERPNVSSEQSNKSSDESEEILSKQTSHHRPAQLSSTNLHRPLGIGFGLSPFRSVPIPYDPTATRLVEFMRHDALSNYQPLLEIWFSIALEDVSSFHLMLANAATLWNERNEVNTDEPTRHYTISINSVRSRINDPIDRMSDGLLGAILGLACQDIRQGHLDRWTIHMRGLKMIIDLRGGLKNLKTVYFLRFSIFWIDLNGSLAEDCSPFFILPEDLIEIRNNFFGHTLLQSSLESLESYHGTTFDINESIISLADMAQFMNDKEASSNFWKDDMAYFHNVLPVIYRILVLPRPYSGMKGLASDCEVKRETLRLACLLFLGLVKRQFRIAPDCVPHYGYRLHQVLIHNSVNWTPAPDLYIWVLCVAAVSALGDERQWIVQTLRSSTRTMSWEKVTSTVRSIAWIEGIASYELEILEKDVQRSQV